MNIIFDSERVDAIIEVVEWMGFCAGLQCILLLAILVAIYLKRAS